MEENKLSSYGGIPTQAVEVAGALVSVGAVWLVAGKGALVASLIASMPAWQRLDPLPILADSEGERDVERKREKKDIADHIFSGASESAADRSEEEQE
jgi:hypothetical protein